MPELNPLSRIVLYADDDIDDIEFVKESFLKDAKDIELVSFTSATELLEYIHSGQSRELPCLIIFDINMPRLNGKEALRLLRNINGYEDVPVVLFTTSTSPLDERFAERSGAGFIPKPLNSEQLDHVVQKFLTHCNESI
jgi:CheY-like chemotaxis protein